ncbi:type II secretion system protein GspM [Acinetobacter terrae]|uniref:Type II secretion system protein M n=1 Tax=Acinetobacter terrae TaxID=2731247 RepID=A0A241VD10_9GAMM|nr:type II secretion system protein GspM [Acinetobacter terrae]NNH15175.1 type II secretion system protein M [Acinetobacter terrae]NNH76982.1 type II secretion system protein M [Acinetobacter terrae]OAL86562.1 type II secretion system protein M [Acinetobacter terrae]OTG73869.1 type II secretion system protein M [Acinetobacter terrae]
MKTSEKLQSSIDQSIERIADYLDRLSVRERYMVIFTTIFVLVAAIGSALWFMHAAANKQQNRVNDLKDMMVWMQSNAVTMKPADDLQLTAADKVQRVAQQQGLSVASQQAGEQIQIVAVHENYAILANFLTQLAQMGLSLEKIELISEAGQIKLTATVQ